MINLISHPISYYGTRFWIGLKILLVSIFIVCFFIDFFCNSFSQSSDLFLIRMWLEIITIDLVITFLIMELIWFLKKRNNRELVQPQIDKSTWEDVFENYRHADNLYHQRFNFFLVAESMLAVSFATTLLVNPENKITFGNVNTIKTAIAILGIIFTTSWFYVNKRLDWRLVYLNDEYLTKNIEYSKYMKSVDKFTLLHTGFFLSNLLPLFTFAFWYFLFYLSRWNLI